jgi:hypothetical protein
LNLSLPAAFSLLGESPPPQAMCKQLVFTTWRRLPTWRLPPKSAKPCDLSIPHPEDHVTSFHEIMPPSSTPLALHPSHHLHPVPGNVCSPSECSCVQYWGCFLPDAAFLTKITRSLPSSPSACLQPFPHHLHHPAMQRQPPPRACLPACRVLYKICLLLCLPFFLFMTSTAFLLLLLLFHRQFHHLPPSFVTTSLATVSSPCLSVGTST